MDQMLEPHLIIVMNLTVQGKQCLDVVYINDPLFVMAPCDPRMP